VDAEGFCFFDTPIGACAIAWRGDVIVGVQLPEETQPRARARLQRRHGAMIEATPPAHVQAIAARVRALLEGERDDLLDVPLDMEGVPPFNQRVYRIARAIPPGRTLTYGEVATQLGDPGAARAVGQALGHNPFAPIVPCHRILAAGGQGGGFSANGGVATKLRMLQIERARFGAAPGLFDDQPA
jgi:methylated-DNA-[protein]-cysteine S-methyltransferase